MEDNRKNTIFKTTEENTDRDNRTPKKTGHTWIGDKDEIRPDFSERPVTRMTFSNTEGRGTKLVQREKKPYRGFITDEEVKYAEAAAEVDRRSRAEERAAREEMHRTKVYTGFGSGMQSDSEPAAETAGPKKRRRSFNITIADRKKFKRLVALFAVFILLVLFELSFVLMKAEIKALPGKTENVRKQTQEVQDKNAQLQREADLIGDYDQIKELRDSWQRLKEKLGESE